MKNIGILKSRYRFLICFFISVIILNSVYEKREVRAGSFVVTVVTKEVVTYLVLSGIISGVLVKDIYESVTGDVTELVSATNSNGQEYQFEQGTEYRLNQNFANAIANGISVEQIESIKNNVTYDGSIMTVGDMDSSLYESISSVNSLIKNNPLLSSYINSSILDGKDLNQSQLTELKAVLRTFDEYEVQRLSSKYKYYCIYPTAMMTSNSTIDNSTVGYCMVFSDYMFYALNKQEASEGVYKSYAYEIFNDMGDHRLSTSFITTLHDSVSNGIALLPNDIFDCEVGFWTNNMALVSNGFYKIGAEEYLDLASVNASTLTLLNWQRYVNLLSSQYYSLPRNNLITMTLDTYMPYDLDKVVVNEGVSVIDNISSLDDFDSVAEYINSGSVLDETNNKTIADSDSKLRDTVVDNVANFTGVTDVIVDSDSWLDRLFDWFSTHLTSLGEFIVSGFGTIADALGLDNFFEFMIMILTGIQTDVLDIGDVLTDIWESLINGLSVDFGSFLDNLIEALGELFGYLFVPADGFLDNKILEMREKFVFADSIILLVNDIAGSILPSEPPRIYLGELDDGNKYGINNIVFLDMTWFKRYKGITDTLISAVMIVMFIWRIFVTLPSTISGGGTVVYYAKDK